MTYSLNIIPGTLTLSQLRQVSRNPVHVSLDSSAEQAINRSAAAVQQVIKDDKVVYGINTGFGLLANTRIQKNELELLQRSIVLSLSLIHI